MPWWRANGEGIQRQDKIDYSFAREMVPFYIDNMVIPADSPNPAAALAFINFVMRPEISASVTRFIGFATANAAAVPLLEPAVRGNTIDLSAAGDPRPSRAAEGLHSR